MLVLAFWLVGFLTGFHIVEHIPSWLRGRFTMLDLALLLLALFIITNYILHHGGGGAGASARAISARLLPARPTAVEGKKDWRSLGQMIAPPPLPPKFHQSVAEEQRRAREEQKHKMVSSMVVCDSQGNCTMTGATTGTLSTGAASGQISTTASVFATSSTILPYGARPMETRKGPFCRVTCTTHHADNSGQPPGTYDVETEPDLCKANKIDPNADSVPGWIQIPGTSYEMLNPWPGPANPNRGLDSYKLYWQGGK